jgi:hypothetical protein
VAGVTTRLQVIERVAARHGGHFHGAPVGDDPAWTPLLDALAPDALREWITVAGVRFGTDDPVVAASLLVREITVMATYAAVVTWSVERRVLDLSPSNVMVRESPAGALIGMRRLRMSVLAGDELAGAAGIDVVADADVLRAVLAASWLRGSVDAVIEAGRAVVHMGQRHLYGNVGLTVVNGLAEASVRSGIVERIDRDRAQLLDEHEELASTVEVFTKQAGATTVTFAIRTTCCLLYKTESKIQCGTCSLLDRESRIRAVGDYYRRL